MEQEPLIEIVLLRTCARIPGGLQSACGEPGRTRAHAMAHADFSDALSLCCSTAVRYGITWCLYFNNIYCLSRNFLSLNRPDNDVHERLYDSLSSRCSLSLLSILIIIIIQLTAFTAVRCVHSTGRASRADITHQRDSEWTPCGAAACFALESIFLRHWL